MCNMRIRHGRDRCSCLTFPSKWVPDGTPFLTEAVPHPEHHRTRVQVGWQRLVSEHHWQCKTDCADISHKPNRTRLQAGTCAAGWRPGKEVRQGILRCNMKNCTACAGATRLWCIRPRCAVCFSPKANRTYYILYLVVTFYYCLCCQTARIQVSDITKVYT